MEIWWKNNMLSMFPCIGIYQKDNLAFNFKKWLNFVFFNSSYFNKDDDFELYLCTCCINLTTVPLAEAEVNCFLIIFEMCCSCFRQIFTFFSMDSFHKLFQDEEKTNSSLEIHKICYEKLRTKKLWFCCALPIQCFLIKCRLL